MNNFNAYPSETAKDTELEKSISYQWRGLFSKLKIEKNRCSCFFAKASMNSLQNMYLKQKNLPIRYLQGTPSREIIKDLTKTSSQFEASFNKWSKICFCQKKCSGLLLFSDPGEYLFLYRKNRSADDRFIRYAMSEKKVSLNKIKRENCEQFYLY